MRKLVFLFPLFLLLFTACKDRDDFMAYSDEKVVKKYFMRGDGDWNIDEAKVWVIDEDDKKVLGETTRTNVGHVKFNSTEAMDWVFVNDTANFTYITMHSGINEYWYYINGSFDWGNDMHGKVISIDKKNMLLFFPAHLNLYTSGGPIPAQSLEFQFKLSKK